MYNPDEECNKLIETLNYLCIQKSMSHYAVAVKAEISPSTVHSLMTGKTKPYVHTLFKLCNAFEMSAEELLFTSKTKDGMKEENGIIDSNFFNILQYLNPDEKEVLIMYHYLANQKKTLLKMYLKMLQQYNL